MSIEEPSEMRGWRSTPGAWQELKGRARQMRRTPTPAEATLWQLLRGGQFGVRFRRQHAIGQFIVDFYCSAAKLVVEIDGSSHDGRAEDDAIRQRYLETQGLRVLRFTNNEVLQRPQAVLATIASAVGGSRPQNLTP